MFMKIIPTYLKLNRLGMYYVDIIFYLFRYPFPNEWR